MDERFTENRGWRLIYPFLIYYGVAILVTMVFSIVTIASMLLRGEAVNLGYVQLMETIMGKMMESTLGINIVSALISIPILGYFFKKDKEKYAGMGLNQNYVPVCWWQYTAVVLMGIGACLVGNNLIYLTGLNAVDPSYALASQYLYQGNWLLELVGLGILVPLEEELVFRGLIYKRMRETTSPMMSMVMISVIFAAFHGNLPQAVFAFIQGMLMCYLYEKYHSFLAPFIFHAASNLFAVWATESRFSVFLYGGPVQFYTITVLAVIILAAGFLYVRAKVKAPITDKVPEKKKEIHRENDIKR